MFLLHERTRKSLCRTGFVLLCVLPTCAVALWAASRAGDGHRTRCEAELGRLLSLKVTLGDVEHPEPGMVRYSDVVLADPDTGDLMVSVASLQVRITDGSVVISAPQATIEPGAAPAVAGLLHAWLRDRTESRIATVRLTVSELRVTTPSGDVPLPEVSARLEPTSEGRGAQFTLHTREMTKDAQPVVLTMVRSRNGRMGFELDSHGALDQEWHRTSPVLQLLRALVAVNDVLVPVTPEAEALLQVTIPTS
jgi:hypothetical protein